MSYQIYNEDCLVGMKRIPDGSVDFILTDLPYQITDCDFDRRIPFAPMWDEFHRVTKPNAAIALFAASKFLIELAASNFREYRYKIVWEKSLGVGFLNAKKMPLRCHEDILIFYRKLPTYNPQFTQGKPYVRTGQCLSSNYRVYGDGRPYLKARESVDGRRYPRDIIYTHTAVDEGVFHPQQKPTDLLEWFIKTYSNEGETVLDATMGSGSTGVACVNTGRNFIGFELNENFFNIAQKRIDEAIAQRAQSLF